MSSTPSDCPIRFQPSGRTVQVPPGTLLLAAAAQAGVIVETPCGGKGTCGKCAVHVTAGECAPAAATVAYFTPAKLAAGWRLACQDRVCGGCTVEVPEAARFDSTAKILTTATGRHLPIQPAVWKKHVELPPPTSAQPAADWERLEQALGEPLELSLEMARALPEFLRRNGFKGTVVGRHREVIGLEPGDTAGRLFGAAFDLGTTTIAGTLLDLHGGRECGVAAVLNPQVVLGDDVISRIERIRANPAELGHLQRRAVQALNGLLDELCVAAGVARSEVYCLTVAGNTTMQQLFCGITPAALGEIPFIPALHRGLACRAADLGLELPSHARLYVLPTIGGFVGGDTVAGLLATNLRQAAGVRLLVDIGTNGEIVLAAHGKLLACSTAAGPAFEGARIRAGMRAVASAIESVAVADGDLILHVIGGGVPAGLCGTALIDLVAELLSLGVIDASGRILDGEELPPGLPPRIRERVVAFNGAPAIRLATAAESRTGEELLLIQRDVRELQLAAAAIRAGILLLLRRAGLEPAALDAVLLAGGFGNFIRRNHALRIGLLPPVASEKIHFIGNASLMGAKAALLSLAERREAERIAGEAEHVDLSLDPEFQQEFGSAMLFPD
ncbi:MAG: ASKHA domain-containing protein [Lentisphaeria bacterium]|jgi:uncharacterized 2Fe-2S/4Fe-4S cluster protein (DUF4445 family)